MMMKMRKRRWMMITITLMLLVRGNREDILTRMRKCSGTFL
jgi:hypothetical protein